MAIAAPGVGSNLDVNNIVTQLMNIEKRPLTQLATKEAAYQAQLSAYGTLKSALSSLRSALSALSNQSNFNAVTAKAADATIFSASALKNATVGSYTVDVTQLAQSQSLLAAGQSSSTATIGAATTTTLSFEFGTISGGKLTNGTYTGASFTPDSSVGTKQVTISSSNNTLQGIRDAINAANIGVKASIINDGGASPYRLVLQSANTGANRSLRISASGDASISSLLSHDPTATQNLTQTAAALDAAIKINGVDISSHSNTVSGALEGVSLTLAKTGSTSLNIARDTASVQSGIEALVKSYNEFEATLGDLSKFDPATKKGGPLIGDSTLRSVENQLRQALTGNISGVSGNSYSVLSQIGLSFQRDGTLSLDSSKLSDALNTDVDAVAALFASVGLSSDSLVEVSKFTSNTAPGIYAVSVSQLATQGTLVGAAAAGLAISASSNDQLTVDVDGTSANITLTAGTYTATDLAAELESKINGASAISGAGLSVKVTESAGVLTVTSGSYGSSSAVSVTGTAASNLFGGSPVAAAGLDVAGTIGGISATGKGQTLVANSTSAADGLELTIAGGNTGDRGVINFSRGYAHRLGLLLDNQIAGDGLIAGRTDGINRSIKDLDSQREALQRRLDLVEQRYRAQFTALDGLISSMNSTSTFLAQQLASLPGTR